MAQLFAFIDRNWIQWYVPTGNPPVLTVNFPQSAVRDLEVLDRGALVAFLQSAIKEHHIEPSQIVMVLSEDTFFWADIPKGNNDDALKEEFLSNVPFENYTTTPLPFASGERIIAVPLEFYETIQKTLESAGFQILAILPVFALSDMGNKRWLDADMVHYIEKNIDKLKQFTIVTKEEIKRQESEKREVFYAKNRRAMVLGVIFFILIFILIVMIFRM